MHTPVLPQVAARRLPGFACLFSMLLLTTNVLAQTTDPTRNPSQFGANLRNRIGNEMVQRQSEIIRVDAATSQLETRISRIERQLLSTHTYPAMTIPEAEAALILAVAQRDEIQNQAGEPSEIQVATAQLAIARAEGQLQITRALRVENLILSELDVIMAEKELLIKHREYSMQQRLVAKGHAKSLALAEYPHAIDAANKKLELMRLRLETQRKLGKMPEPGIGKNTPSPPSVSRIP